MGYAPLGPIALRRCFSAGLSFRSGCFSVVKIFKKSDQAAFLSFTHKHLPFLIETDLAATDHS
jgi:hypothetical protein